MTSFNLTRGISAVIARLFPRYFWERRCGEQTDLLFSSIENWSVDDLSVMHLTDLDLFKDFLSTLYSYHNAKLTVGIDTRSLRLRAESLALFASEIEARCIVRKVNFNNALYTDRGWVDVRVSWINKQQSRDGLRGCVSEEELLQNIKRLGLASKYHMIVLRSIESLPHIIEDRPQYIVSLELRNIYENYLRSLSRGSHGLQSLVKCMNPDVIKQFEELCKKIADLLKISL